MTHMLCRNRVADFDAWYEVFASHAVAQRESGLHLKHLWHDRDDRNNVFFLFKITDKEKAAAFLRTAGAAEAADTSGQIEAEYHFLVEDATD